MSESKQVRRHLKSARGKIIVAFLLILVFAGVSYIGYQLVFQEMLEKVEKFATPDSRLELSREVYETFTVIDQRQRQLAISQPGALRKDLNKDFADFNNLLDSLEYITRPDSLQLQKIKEIKFLLQQREELYQAFIGARKDFFYNKNLNERIQSISKLIVDKAEQQDTQIIHSERRTISTTILPADSIIITQEENPGFFKRMFGKKKKVTFDTITQAPSMALEEQILVKTDTLAIGEKDTIQQIIRKEGSSRARDQRKQNTRMLRQEMAFLNATIILSNEILQILHHFEATAVSQLQDNTAESVSIARNSILRSTLLLGIFLLIIGLLVYFILVDLARGSRYRQQLIEEKEKTLELSRQKEKFLANISHEIRTPLQSIIGYSEQMQKQEVPDKADLQVIHTSSNYLLHIVNELLDYSSIISGKLNFRNQVFSLKSSTLDVIKILQPQAEAKGILLEHFTDSLEGIYVDSDEFRYQQILFNLVGNAIKFTSEGGVSVHSSVQSNGTYCTLFCKIKDSGPGIAAEDLNSIFIEFERIESDIKANIQGTGLGLSIVKAIIDAWDGKIDLKSSPGTGTEFSFQLTFKLSEWNNTSKSEVPHDFILNNSSPVILIIDDDPFILQLCTTILHSHNIPNVATTDPYHAIQILKENPPSVVLMDMRMPLMSGPELSKKMKNMGNVPIIAMTAQRIDKESGEELALQFDAVLYKPFKEIELMQAINLFLNPDKAFSDFEYNLNGSMLDGLEEELKNALIMDCIIDSLKDLQQLNNTSLLSVAAEIMHQLASRLGQIGYREVFENLRRFEYNFRMQSTSSEFIPKVDKVELLKYCEILEGELEKRMEELKSLSSKE
ncbi:MAG: response regulator [Saprospiraceae bacterium]|nr:response regulator [Saprospiraceae bacterium]